MPLLPDPVPVPVVPLLPVPFVPLFIEPDPVPVPVLPVPVVSVAPVPVPDVSVEPMLLPVFALPGSFAGGVLPPQAARAKIKVPIVIGTCSRIIFFS